MPPCQFLAGIDASDFDWGRGPMDVAAAARDGIVFFTHKATEGTRIQHVHYGEALNRARAAGMPCMGAYMIPRTPGNNGHGTIPQQVAYFLAYLDAQTPWWRSTATFFLQVDTEHWGYDDVAPQYGADTCALLRGQTGKFVIHYAPRWAYGDTIPGKDPLWASSYGTNPAVPYRQAYPGDGSSGWATYSRRVPTFLQYGSRLTIGSQSGCDANAFRGTLAELRTLITGGDMPLTPDDITAIKVAVNGGPGSLTIDQLQQWLGDGVDGRDPKRPSVDPRPNLRLVAQKLDALAAPVAPTQDQVDAAILKAMQDPAVQKGIGDAIASHLHVT